MDPQAPSIPIAPPLPTTRTSTSAWSWLFGAAKPPPMSPTDASQDPAVRAQFIYLLDHTEPPAVFKPSDVANLLSPKDLARMGYDDPKEAIPAIRELAFELREFGDCHILQKGVKVPEHVGLLDIEGPIRIRRRVGL